MVKLGYVFIGVCKTSNCKLAIFIEDDITAMNESFIYNSIDVYNSVQKIFFDII